MGHQAKAMKPDALPNGRVDLPIGRSTMPFRRALGFSNALLNGMEDLPFSRVIFQMPLSNGIFGMVALSFSRTSYPFEIWSCQMAGRPYHFARL